jgi:hypothetical protein
MGGKSSLYARYDVLTFFLFSFTKCCNLIDQRQVLTQVDAVQRHKLWQAGSLIQRAVTRERYKSYLAATTKPVMFVQKQPQISPAACRLMHKGNAVQMLASRLQSDATQSDRTELLFSPCRDKFERGNRS